MSSSNNTDNNNNNNDPDDDQQQQQQEVVVNLICSAASLLSGDLDECMFPDDPSCKGGMASVMAYARNLTQSKPTLIIQKFDKNSPFVNTHPLQWVVNRLILNEIFGLDLFFSTPSLLLQNKVDTEGVSIRDITDLQFEEFAFLIANTEVSPQNSWHPYVKTVHFDSKTGLALIAIADTGVPLSINQADAAKGSLNYIATLNQRHGCTSTLTNYQQYLIDNNINSVPTTTLTTTTTTTTLNGTITTDHDNEQHQNNRLEEHCWIPIILYDSVEEKYNEFLEEVIVHVNPPALIVNIDDSYEAPGRIPMLYKDTQIWVGDCPMDDENYCQHRIALSNPSNWQLDQMQQQHLKFQPEIIGVEFINKNLDELPSEFKDSGWNATIEELRKLADQALDNNPIVGYSGFMPVTRVGSYRGCQGGECPLGSLFTEALRWFTDSDIAFTSSGGYRGPGWPAGPVTLTDLYGGLPFPNSECTGIMSGLSLFKLLNYTTSVATFEGEDTTDGDRLLQVAGMQVSYNTRMAGSRLVGVDVWNRNSGRYEPIDRLKMYKFASDSYVCGAYDPYPDLTGGNFALEGEQPGMVGENLVQNIVADYLSQLDQPWDTSFQGRLQNHTRNFDVLDLIQNEDSCGANTAWDEQTLTCIECPSFEFVVFSDDILRFEADSSTDIISDGRVILVNREPTSVAVVLKSKPRWVEFTLASKNFGTVNNVGFVPIPLESGESLVLEFDVVASSLGSGGARSALGSVSFGVQDGGQYPGCTGQDAIFDVQLSVTPPTEYNYLGNIFYVGVTLVGVVGLTCLAATGWVYMFRTTRVVKVMQPVFLLTILCGVFIMSTTMIPVGIDDGMATQRGCDIACMSVPWLLSTGFTISFSALFSKLWRINRLFNATPGIRRVVVRHQDVLAPFVVLFTLNLGLLLAWTIADPLKWKRFSIEGEEWNTYGTCVGGTVSIILVSLLAVVNFGALLLACIQAYLARSISDDFSESKYIGIAIYGWFQILIVGVPILFLIDADNPTARYILVVTLIFIVSMSMLLIIFVPAYFNFKRMRHHPREHMTETRITGVTGMADVSGLKTHSAASGSGNGSGRSIGGTALTRKEYALSRNVPLAVMDSIDERTPSMVEQGTTSQADRVSADAETKLLDSASRNRKRMIEQQINLKESSMAEKVNNMMLAMQSDDEDSSSDDSSTSSAKSSTSD